LGAGTNSAFGLLTAPVAVDLSRSYNAALDGIQWGRVNALFKEMEKEALRMLAGTGLKEPAFVRTADLRFVGQGFELPASVPSGILSAASARHINDSFHDAYRSVYESLPGKLPVEAITWRLRASGPAHSLSASSAHNARSRGFLPARSVYFQEAGRYIETPVYDRYGLKQNDEIRGPAIVEEREATAVIGPSGNAVIDSDLNLIIHIDAAKVR
jgi:N-methylhydantoinase A